MNIFLNEYFLFNFELNIKLNHFLARFNVKMNNQNVSATPTFRWHLLHSRTCHNAISTCAGFLKSPPRMVGSPSTWAVGTLWTTLLAQTL